MRIPLILTILCMIISVHCPSGNYCTICSNGEHIMCKYKKGPSLACHGYRGSEINQQAKYSIVEFHNKLRSKVAQGLELRGNPGPQPAASNMMVMDWDNELAEIAQRIADQCFDHKHKFVDSCRLVGRFPYGIMIASLIYHKDVPLDLAYAFKYWYDNVQRFNALAIENFTLSSDRNTATYRYYTQMVWAETRFIGCGHAAFQANDSQKHFIHRLICNYGPAGNVVGAAVYKRGEMCSSCPKGYSCSENYVGLCSNATEPSTVVDDNPINQMEIVLPEDLGTNDRGFTELFNTESSYSTLSSPNMQTQTIKNVIKSAENVVDVKDGENGNIYNAKDPLKYSEGEECYCGYVMRIKNSKGSLVYQDIANLYLLTLFVILVFV